MGGSQVKSCVSGNMVAGLLLKVANARQQRAASSDIFCQALGKITAEGVFLEQLETNPAKYLPDVTSDSLGGEVVQVKLRVFILSFDLPN